MRGTLTRKHRLEESLLLFTQTILGGRASCRLANFRSHEALQRRNRVGRGGILVIQACVLSNADQWCAEGCLVTDEGAQHASSLDQPFHKTGKPNVAWLGRTIRSRFFIWRARAWSCCLSVLCAVPGRRVAIMSVRACLVGMGAGLGMYVWLRNEIWASSEGLNGRVNRLRDDAGLPGPGPTVRAAPFINAKTLWQES